MRFFDLPNASILLLATCLSTSVVAFKHDDIATHRMLRAATKRTDLYKRGMRITKKHEAEVAYVEEENGWGGKSTFASQVKVRSQKPIMGLEEMEHHLQEVKCEDGVMNLHFVDKSSARDAFHSCQGGLIITSHEGCNKPGERAVYRVNDASFAKDGEALSLSTTPTSWDSAFDHFDISFGHTTHDHIFRRHSDFYKVRSKRQEIEIPEDTDDNVRTATIDLSSKVLNKTFAAADFLAGLEQFVNVPAIPDLPIEVGCKNCTTTGEIVLSQGAISIDLSQIDLIPDFLQGGDDGKSASDVITGGFMELSAKGVGARLELFARPKASGSFEIGFLKLPVLGFVVPGIGKAGVVFEPRIAVDFDISGGFELNYGIEVQIPDNSNIRVELTDIGSSGVNGFPGSKLTPLPFQVNVKDVDILLGLAFIPTIPIGFEFVGKLEASVDVSMELPRLDARLSTNVNKFCGKNGTNATKPHTKANGTSSLAADLRALGPLALVEANVTLSVDVGLGVTLPLIPAPLGEIAEEANLFYTKFPLITTCVNARDAVKTMTGIVAAPSMKTFANVTVKTSAPATAAATPIKTPMKRANSTRCTTTTTVYASAPTNSTTQVSIVTTAPPAPPQITPLPVPPPPQEDDEVVPPPPNTNTSLILPGFTPNTTISPTNGTLVRQTSPPEFTGAAASNKKSGFLEVGVLVAGVVAGLGML